MRKAVPHLQGSLDGGAARAACGAGFPAGTPLYRHAGCPDCAMTGYRGRFSILEILTMTAELERLIAAGEAADKIAGRRQGAGA